MVHSVAMENRLEREMDKEMDTGFLGGPEP